MLVRDLNPTKPLNVKTDWSREMKKEIQDKREEIVKKCYYRDEYAERDAFRSGFDDCYKIMSQEILESRASQFESTIKETMSTRDKLAEENNRLKRIIAQEFNENDELGSEFVYVRILKDEVATLNEKLKIATEALEFYSKESSYYVNGAWDIKNHIDDSDLEQKIIYQELISVGGKRAREALDKLKEIDT